MTPRADPPSPAPVLLVGLGGAVGSLLRWLVSLVLPHDTPWHWSTLTVNLLGAFLLGLLLESLATPARDCPARRRLRPLLGTGLLGGFTTYSTFALDLTGSLGRPDVPGALGYLAVSLVAGLLAAGAGIVVATRRRPRRGAGGAGEAP